MSLRNWKLRLFLALSAVLLAVASPHALYAAPVDSFYQHNLVSDLPNIADFQDPDLVNPWGISFSPTSPFWISDNHTGLATIYNSFGVKQGLTVTIPPPNGQMGPAAPTGQVFNPNSANFGGSHFIFATEDGTISGWNGGTNAVLKVDNSPAGTVYKGLAMGSVGNNSYLYATDFHNGAINVFDSSFNQVNLAGSFTDPNLPSGYAPFNIEAHGNLLYVTYAVQDAARHDDVAGPGHGIVDVFDMNGNLIQRLISHGALNSPWGMAFAPAGFGPFGGDLLVGNFGNGWINVFDPTTGALLGWLQDSQGNPIVDLGLWDITFGNGGNGGSPDKLYFTAGIPGNGNVEDHGLFGVIAVVPEPGSLALLGSGLLGLSSYRWRKTSKS